MNLSEVKERIAKIEDKAHDDEIAHIMEDDLMRELVDAYCPPDIVAEIEALSKIDFSRWYA